MTRHAPMRQALGALVASLATVAPAAAHVTTAPAVAVLAAAPPSAALEAAASGFLPAWVGLVLLVGALALGRRRPRSEEHTSELQSQANLVCRPLLEKKKNEPRCLP